jgi:hypothetical protein
MLRFDNKTDDSLAMLLLLSGVVGVVLGLLTATWQTPIETSQVLLGLVRHEPTAVPYAYHASVFSVVNYIGCLFLALTDSEVSSSILLAGLMGVLSMQALALVVFFVLRNTYQAVLITGLLGTINYFGTGLSYPILFMGSEHTYGRAGLILVVYAIALLGLARYRLGFFLCGITLAVHPPWGLWLNACLMAVLLFQYGAFKPILNKVNVSFYLSGVLIAVGLFAWQRINFDLNLAVPAHDPDASRIAFLNYTRYWDYHRQKFSNPSELLEAFTYSFLSLYFVIRALKDSSRPPEKLFCYLVAASALLSSVFVFIPSWFDPRHFPEQLVALMPGRFINLTIFLATPLWIGGLAIAVNRSTRSLGFYILIITLSALAVYSAGKGDGARRIAAMMYLTCAAALYVDMARRRFSGAYPLITVEHAAGRIPNSRAFAVSVASIALVLSYYVVRNIDTMRHRFDTVTMPGNFSGTVLVTFDRWLLQMETRQATIVPHIDGYAYLGKGSILALNRLTTDIFGISIADVPSKNLSLHGSVIFTTDYKALWEARKCAEWEVLAGKYKFGMIFTPAHVQLSLPKADKDPLWNKYLPKCSKQVSGQS